jgi:ubiquinone/menaquinone biosynthesis C-methylase UbiE
MNGKGHKRLVQEQFTKTAKEYSHWATEQSGNEKSDIIFFDPQPEDKALDVACGPGTLSLKLAPHVRQVIGIDLTDKLLSIAAHKKTDHYLTNIFFIRGDVEDLGFSKESFDLVVCGSALHHFTEPERVFQEMVRVCKRSGKIGVIDIVSPEDEDEFHFSLRIQRLRDPSHAGALKVSQIESLFRTFGLHSIHQRLMIRRQRFSQWAETAGLKPGDARYREIWDLLLDSTEGNRTGWNVKSIPEDLEFDRKVFYIYGIKKPERR